MEKIQVFDREKNELFEEKIYGSFWVRLLYENWWSRWILVFIPKFFVSRLYGLFNNSAWSRRKVAPFIENFSIKMEEYQEGSLHNEVENSENEAGLSTNKHKAKTYRHFNEFFYRKFHARFRPFNMDKHSLPSPCESRVLGANHHDENDLFKIKGLNLDLETLLGSKKYVRQFAHGPFVILRLCPVDYHRFHFPDTGKLIEQIHLPGKLHSVSPLAIHRFPSIIMTNDRVLSVLETENFGKIAMLEVGAMGVGKIVQTYGGNEFERGQEKGLFEFGGSTVLLLGEKNKWELSEDIVQNSLRGIETFIKLGDTLGKLL